MREIWVNGMDPLDPYKDPDEGLEVAKIGQQFWSHESMAGWITLQDLKDAVEEGRRSGE